MTIERKYKVGDIVSILVKIVDNTGNGVGDNWPYEAIHINGDDLSEGDTTNVFFSDSDIIKKLTPSDIEKIHTSQKQEQLKAIENQIKELQAAANKIKAEIAPKPKAAKGK